MNTQILEELGLSKREIAVYIALHELGPTTTGPLVKLSGVQNSKIYETLEKLIKKGLVSYILKQRTKHFQATNPGALLDILKEKQAATREIVHELMKLREKKEPEYESKIYKGIKAIKTVFYEMYDYLGKNGGYMVFPIGEQLGTQELVRFWSQILRKAKELGIIIKTLPNKKLKKIFETHYKKYKFIHIRYTGQEFPSGIFIFKNHVLYVNWGEKPFATLIKSKDNYVRWQKFFNRQWYKATEN